jgi:HSP20 family protein
MLIEVSLDVINKQPAQSKEDKMANWDLFKELENLRREIDEAFTGFGGRRIFDQTFLPGPGFKRSPRINLSGDGDNLYVEALLPGVAVDKLDMTVQQNTLTIAGERKINDEDQAGRTWHRRERGEGKFLRTVELPVEIDPGKVTAEYQDGVLYVKLPKAEAARPKKIEIRAA